MKMALGTFHCPTFYCCDYMHCRTELSASTPRGERSSCFNASQIFSLLIQHRRLGVQGHQQQADNSSILNFVKWKRIFFNVELLGHFGSLKLVKLATYNICMCAVAKMRRIYTKRGKNICSNFFNFQVSSVSSEIKQTVFKWFYDTNSRVGAIHQLSGWFEIF